MGTKIAGIVGKLLQQWAEGWRDLRRHPLVDPSWPKFSRVGLGMFIALIVVALVALLRLTDLDAFTSWQVWTLAVLITITELAQIQIEPERQMVLNDVFYLVPFSFLPLSEAAALLLVVMFADPLLHPHPLHRTLARFSSRIVLSSSGLAAIMLARFLLDGTSIDGSLQIVVLIAAGLFGIRFNDYVIFPATVRVAVGPGFDWGEYYVRQAQMDRILVPVELPLAIVAAFAFDREWLSLLLLVIPYGALWQLSLLRPRVDELERADEVKSRFLSMASHELRTPLTSIQGFASTLTTHWDRFDDAEKLKYLGVVDEQSQRLGRLIDDLLTMSRIEAGALSGDTTNLRLEPILERARAQFGSADIAIACPADVWVEADPDYTEQIIVNYVGNAMKYGAEPIEIQVEFRDGTVDVQVRDHGPGVPPEFVPRLFDRFTQAEEVHGPGTRGTGLGLSIARELARLQGGDAWYRVAEPEGSTFVVRLLPGKPEAEDGRDHERGGDRSREAAQGPRRGD